MSGAGHSASIHSKDAQTAIDFAAAVECYRVIVNAPCSQGAAGFATNLPPSFTVGTGFFGRSSIGENIGPQHLLHWTKLAYNSDPAEVMGDYGATRIHHQGPLGQGTGRRRHWQQRTSPRKGLFRGTGTPAGRNACLRAMASPVTRFARSSPKNFAPFSRHADHGRAEILHLHRPIAAADALLHRHLAAGVSAADETWPHRSSKSRPVLISRP